MMQSELVDRQLKVADAVCFGFGHCPGTDIDLHRGQQQLGYIERGVARFAYMHIVGFGDAGANMDVVGPLRCNRGFTAEFAATGGIVVADKHACRRR